MRETSPFPWQKKARHEMSGIRDTAVDIFAADGALVAKLQSFSGKGASGGGVRKANARVIVEAPVLLLEIQQWCAANNVVVKDQALMKRLGDLVATMALAGAGQEE